MKDSIIILGSFLLGVFLSFYGAIPDFILADNYSVYVLYVLIFLVGLSIGRDDKIRATLRHPSWNLFVLPVGTIIGTLIGSALVSLILPHRSLSDCLAVGSGMGYYSLSSIIITEYRGVELGTISLVANIIRELCALTLAPLFVLISGKLAPISVGGATTADTTLPIITRYSGKEYMVLAVFHGFIIDTAVPLLVSLFCTL